ncbi:MAG: maleylacetoacetate isomerase [Dyella sp.]
MDTQRVLYDYWRSSAAYRVRIALNFKRLDYDAQAVHLVRDGGEQHTPAYAALNPQRLLPALAMSGQVLTQSLAIIEYLEEAQSEPPLLPADALGRARVRSLAQVIACDTHPLCNLRVVQRLGEQFGADEAAHVVWIRHWIGEGLRAFEALLQHPATGAFCHGDHPGLADVCLVPQVYNAMRWKLPLDAYPSVARIHARCADIEAFAQARPERQPDAPT